MVNTKAQVARHPRGWLVDDDGVLVSNRSAVSGGVLAAMGSGEVRLDVAALERPMRLWLSWFDEAGEQRTESHVDVPRPDSRV